MILSITLRLSACSTSPLFIPLPFNNSAHYCSFAVANMSPSHGVLIFQLSGFSWEDPSEPRERWETLGVGRVTLCSCWQMMRCYDASICWRRKKIFSPSRLLRFERLNFQENLRSDTFTRSLHNHTGLLNCTEKSDCTLKLYLVYLASL